MSVTWSEASKIKIIEPADLEKTVLKIRGDGANEKTIATLNGSFDLLHAGHLEIIYAAKQEADILIVALNSDASIKAYKDPKRPIIRLEHRVKMMTALEFVDYVTWFDETDPCKILSVIKPNVHVNGAEYGSECIEAETVKKHGGRIKIISLVPGLSTSKIIEKIKAL